MVANALVNTLHELDKVYSCGWIDDKHHEWHSTSVPLYRAQCDVLCLSQGINVIYDVCLLLCFIQLSDVEHGALSALHYLCVTLYDVMQLLVPPIVRNV